MRCWYPFCCDSGEQPPVYYCNEACLSEPPSSVDIVIAGMADLFNCTGGTPWNGTWNLSYIGELQVSTFPQEVIWECQYFHNIAAPFDFRTYDQFASFPNTPCSLVGGAWLRCSIGHNFDTGERYISVVLHQEAVGFASDVEEIRYFLSYEDNAIDCANLNGVNIPYDGFSAGFGGKAFDAENSTCTLFGV